MGRLADDGEWYLPYLWSKASGFHCLGIGTCTEQGAVTLIVKDHLQDYDEGCVEVRFSSAT